jgi:hypothetical protein
MPIERLFLGVTRKRRTDSSPVGEVTVDDDEEVNVTATIFPILQKSSRFTSELRMNTTSNTLVLP